MTEAPTGAAPDERSGKPDPHARYRRNKKRETWISLGVLGVYVALWALMPEESYYVRQGIVLIVLLAALGLGIRNAIRARRQR